MQDYWLIRDLFSDPVVSKHAEILLDRTLIDMAEDTVMGMYTGAAGRYYESLPTEGINQHVHIIDYLLFDSLGYELPLDHEYVWGFGAWGYANMIASDYNPTSPDFPKAIVDLAIDKEDGTCRAPASNVRRTGWRRTSPSGSASTELSTAKASPAGSTCTTSWNAALG